MTKTPADFRSVIREALGERSLYWLAKESGVPYMTVHDYLTGDGENGINSRNLQAVAATLGLTLQKAARPAANARKIMASPSAPPRSAVPR